MAKEKANAAAMKQNKFETQTATRDQERIENRSRLESGPATMQRSNRSATSGRNGGSRRGSGKR